VKRSRLIFFLILTFSLGFALHWLITSLQTKPAASLILGGQNVLGQKSFDQFITYIDYDGSKFNPKTVTIKKGNYIAITNKSKDKFMWLISDNVDLNTKRGFGEGERLQLMLLTEGSYKVVDKLNSKAILTITVE
jgi:plastocyanin